MESNQTPMVGLEQTTDVVKVRCPSCFKLYGVETSEIHGSKPQFQCVRCQTKFWFSYPDSLGQEEILGFPAEWLNPQTPSNDPQPAPKSMANEVLQSRTYHCPRCEAQYASGDKECPKCGVIFAKLEFVEEGPTVASSPALRKLWRQVMDNYASLPLHQKFLQAANRERNLLFASHQYARLLKAHSGDEMALQMQKEIMVLTEVQSGVANSTRTKSTGRRLLPSISTLALLAGGIMIGVGFVVPVMRNLIGLGVAAVFFTLAADWVLRRTP